MSQDLTLTRDIAAEPATVWAVLTDLDSAADVLSGVESLEKLTDGPYRIGTRWRETRSALGRDDTREVQVTHMEALGMARLESDAGGARHATTFRLEPLHPGTRLTMQVEGAPEPEGTVAKLAAKVLAPVGAAAARKSVETDLDDIARAAEARSTTRG